MIDPDFQLFHKYRRLVRRGQATPLECDACGGEFITALGKNDELVLNCSACGRNVIPGMALKDRVKAIVSEYFID